MDDQHQTQSLKELINKFLVVSPFQRQLTTAMARYKWHTMMPKIICEKTAKLYVHHNKIFLKITSAPLRHELQCNKTKLFASFQEAMPNIPFQDIVFL